MSQSTYKFDPYGSNDENIVTENRLQPVTPLKVIIPYHAPFYTSDFEIKQGTKVLKEGVDFYFGLRYATGAHQTAQRMCGGIWIINRALTGPYDIKYRTLGTQYGIAKERATQYLAESLEDPASETWEDVLGGEPFFPPVDIQFDKDSFIWEPQLVAAIERISAAIVGQEATESDYHELAELTIRWIEHDINTSGWAEHLAATGAVHGLKHHHAGALHKDGIAQDALLVNGLTRDQLMQQILTAADLSAELAKKFPLAADRTLTGNLVLRDALAHLARTGTSGKLPTLDLSEGVVSSVAERSFHAWADKNANRPGEKLTIAAGDNELTIESAGASTDDRMLKFNGQEVITENTLAGYAATESSYGALDYLPIPVAGDYKAAGFDTDVGYIFGVVEQNGRFVYLRNAADEFYHGLYYGTAEITPEGVLSKVNPTTSLYKHPVIGYDHPEKIVATGVDLFIMKTSGGHYIVKANGTLDPSKNTVAKVVGLPQMNIDYRILVVGSYIYVVYAYMDAAGPITVQAWRAVASGLVQGGNLTFNPVTISGNDLFGDPITPSTTAYLCRNGGTTANNPAWKGIWYRKSGDRSMSVPHAGASLMCAAEGNAIRFALIFGIWCPNAYSSVDAPGGGRGFKLSFEIAISGATHQLVYRTPNQLPLAMDGDNVIWNGRYYQGFQTQRNFRTTFNPLDSRFYLAVRTWGSIYPPEGAILDAGPTNTLFAQLGNIDVLGTHVGVLSAFGVHATPLRSFFRHWAALGNSYAAVKNKDGTAVLVKYVEGGKFVDDKIGHGPTNERVQMSMADYVDIVTVPMNYFTNGTNNANGVIFSDDRLESYSSRVNNVPSGLKTIDASVIAAIKAQLVAAIPGESEVMASRLSLYNFTGYSAGKIAVLACLHRERSPGASHYTKYHIFKVNYTVVGNAYTAVTNAGYALGVDVNSNAVGVGGTQFNGGNYMVDFGGGRVALILNANHEMVLTGDTQSRAITIVGNGLTWDLLHVTVTHGSAMDTVLYDPLYGFCVNNPSAHGETLFSTFIGKTEAQIRAGTGTYGILHMTRPATGWTMIFTAEVLGIINNQEYRFPRATIDIQQLFPTAHQNKTFYVYAQVVDGVPGYLVSPTELKTTRARIGIGYLKTDAQRITEIVITARGSASKPIYESSESLIFSGNGNGSSPLVASVPMPDATSSKSGLALLMQQGSTSAGPRAVSQKAVTDAKGLLDSLVPNTRTVAGQPLTGDIIVDKGVFGLDRVDNVADADYIANSHHYNALESKSPKVHSHQPADLIVQVAGLTKKGITKFATGRGNAEDVAIRSDFVARLEDTARIQVTDAKQYMPDDVLSITRYGTYSYLPIPAQGNYPAAGIGGGTAVGELEDDGTFVFLRNGGDAISVGAYYAYCKMNMDGTIAKFVPTTMEYTPLGLPAGVKVRSVLRGSEGVFFFVGTDNANYMALTNGTMDFTKHKVVKITGVNVRSIDVHPIIAEGKVCIVSSAMEGSGRIFVRLWTIPLASIDENTKEVTPQLIQLSGNDLYGNAVGPIDPFYFTKVGQSTNPADEPLAHFTTAKWGTRNVRHASNDFDVVARGDKLRVLNCVQSYFANAYTSSNAEWPMSFVIDLTARTVQHDYDGPMPIVVDDSGIKPKRWANAEECGFSGASGNALGVIIRSKGTVFAIGSDGTQWVPTMRKIVQNDKTHDEFDDYHFMNRAATALSGVHFIGNYGSALTGGLKCIRMIEGNRIAGPQSNGAVIIEYVNNSGFGVPGYGPTMNRKMLDGPTWDGLRKIPSIVKDGAVKNQGFVFADGNLSGNSVFSGDALSVPISIDSAEWTKLRTACKTWWDGLGVDPNYFIEDRLMLYVTPEASIPPVVVYYVARWQDNDKVVKGKQAVVFEATVTKRTGNIGAVLLGNTILQQAPVFNHLSLYTDFYARVGTHYGQLDGGRWWMALNSGPGMPSIGSAPYTWAPVLVFNTNTKAWEWSGWSSPSTHTTDGLIFTPEWGPADVFRDSTAEAVYGNVRGLTMAEWVTGNSTRKVLSMTRVQEGWSVYFTEEVQGIMNGNQWQFPKKGFDLKALFPAGHANSKFYIYADVTSGTADYRFSKTELQEGYQLVKVGYCETDAERITALRVDAVTSITNFRELEDHIKATNVHGLDRFNKETLGYGKVANFAPQFELSNIGFADVFNSWKRFSHHAANWNQPANATELNAWAYDAVTDTVKCTVNSATYIGFVSDREIGDFNFDVEVGLPLSSTDGDNDSITLVIAFKTKDGKEHNLSVVRSGSIENHLKVTTLFGVYYDYQLPDQKPVGVVNTGEANFVWKGHYARLRVTRRGEHFVVESTPATQSSWAAAVDADFVHKIEFSLSDMPELAVFKGLNRFGYGALSQTHSTYRAFVRPDVDDRAHYATMGAVLKELYWQQNIAVITGTVRDGGVVPLPAGFAAKETMTFLYPHRRVEGDPMAKRPMTGLGISFNETTRVATARANYSGGFDPIEMAYYVLGMPSGNLLKK